MCGHEFTCSVWQVFYYCNSLTNWTSTEGVKDLGWFGMMTEEQTVLYTWNIKWKVIYQTIWKTNCPTNFRRKLNTTTTCNTKEHHNILESSWSVNSCKEKFLQCVENIPKIWELTKYPYVRGGIDKTISLSMPDSWIELK